MVDVNGTFEPRFAPVVEAFAGNFDKGTDVGASVAISVEGELVVDVWGGHTTAERTAAWQSDTITNVWSTTKTMTALSALMLVDRGLLDPHAPVATYWPEFAANGKEAVTTAHLLSHAAGLPGWAAPMQAADLYDWDLSCARLAAQAPLWEPGTSAGYHALTQGYLVGEVIRRVCGDSVGTFFAKEVAGPLGADFHIGLDPAHFDRVSNVIPPEEPRVDPVGSPELVAQVGNPALDASQAWEPSWRQAEIPAAGGHGNARSVCQVQTAIANRGVSGGVRLLSEAGAERPLEVQYAGTDVVFGGPIRYGLGYGVVGPEIPLGTSDRVCFWGGWGGSIVVNDLDNRMTIAYVMNRMAGGTLGDDRGLGIVFSAYGCV